jgi:hypothetical protein
VREPDRKTASSAGGRLALLALLGVLAAAPLWYVRVIDRYVPQQRSGLLPRWVGTRAALAGRDPYSPEVLREIQTAFYGHPLAAGDAANPETFLYPAPVVILLAPLAPLSWQGARAAFLLVTCPLLAWGFWLCIGRLGPSVSAGSRAAVLVLALCSWPVVWGLRMLQLTMPVAALILIAWALLARGRQWLPGILLALVTIKPQLALPVLAWLLLWAVMRRRWALIGSFAATLTVLLAVTEEIVPGWFGHWRASLNNYTGVTHTALPLEHLLGHWGGLAVTLAIAGSSAVALWRLRRSAPESAEFGLAMSLVLATTVCLVPMNPPLIYNFVLLLPACLVLALHRRGAAIAQVVRVLALAQLGVGFAVVVLAAAMDLTGHLRPVVAYLPFLDYLLPPLVAAALALQALAVVGAPAAQTREIAEPVPAAL